MASNQELLGKVAGLKVTSDELATMIGGQSQQLVKMTARIAMLTQGSQSGGQAVAQLNVASKALMDSALSLKALGRASDEYIANLRK